MDPEFLAPVPGSAPAGGRVVVWGGAAGLLVLHAVLAWYLTIPGIGTGNDDAVYLLLARSLRDFSYRDIFYVGAPVESQYPPLYPAFLALLGGLFGERPWLFVGANIVLSVAGLALVFDVVRRHSAVVALSTLAMLAINPLLLNLAGGIRSEPLAMALTGLSLWLLARPSPGRAAMGWAGAAAIGAALARSAAVTLIAGVGLFWLLRRKWGAVVLLGVASALTVGSWLAWTVLAPRQLPGRSYVADATYQPVITAPAPSPAPVADPDPSVPAPADTPAASAVPVPAPADTPVASDAPAKTPSPGLLGTLALRVRVNVPAYVRTFMETLGPPDAAGTSLDSLVWLSLFTVLGVAGLLGMARWWLAAVLALGCHGLLLALWAYPYPRYIAPLLPFILVAVFWGAAAADGWLRRRRPGLRPRQLIPLGLAVAILAGAVPRLVRQVGEASACRLGPALPGNACRDPVERAFHEATAFIAATTPDTARFLAAKEAAFHYYTARQVIPIYGATAGQVPDLSAYMEANGAEYIFLSHLKRDEWVLVRPLLDMCRGLELVRRWEATTLLLRRGAGGPDGAACEAILAYDAAPWGNR